MGDHVVTEDRADSGISTTGGGGLKIEDVSRAFPGVQALSHVSFDVRPGEVHGLVGENGAGKSTLMAIASGTLLPDEGSVVINGETLGSVGPEYARDLGLAIVYQHPALMPDLTISENLYMGVPKRARPNALHLDSWAGDQLKKWDPSIGLKATDRIAALVPEEKFIVEITKALAPGPSVLILDEPTEHLSTDDVQRLFANIRELRDAGCAIVYISHRVREVREISDRLTVLRDGKTQGTYPAKELGESEVVNLIVGRPLATTFPPKATLAETAPVVLHVDELTGAGFNDVSLALRQGEIVGLAGIQGNGQREFLRALAGLQPNKGVVTLSGEKISTRTPVRARDAGVAYVPSDRHLEGIVGDLSVRENLSMRSLAAYATAGIVRKRREMESARENIAKFRIKTPSPDTVIGSLSGGNQQKAVLASALASKPKLLLADEPTQGVDVGARLEIYQLLRTAAEQGTAVIVVSSDALELAGLCDRVLVFSRGSVVADDEEVSERAITGAILTATSERIRPQRASRFVTFLAGNIAPMASVSIAILALAVVAATLNGTFLSERGIGSVLALATTLALVAFGQLLVMAVGGIDLSVGPLMGTLVVIASFFFTSGSSIPNQAVGWVLFFATALVVGFVNWVLSDLVKMGAVIATLATFTALQGLSLTLRSIPDGLISIDLITAITTRLGPIPVMFLIAVLVALVGEFAFFRTLLGMSLRGVGSRREAARIVGVKPLRINLIAHLACSFFAALAAIPLMAQVGIGDASAGSDYTLISIAAIVIGGASIFGGRGSFIGALLAAILIVELNSVTTYLRLDLSWSQFLLGGMMIAAVAVYSKSRQLEVPR
jgi:ribose transport system ATP-binding protein